MALEIILINQGYSDEWRVMDRAGNRAGRIGLGGANSGLGQDRTGPKLARFFRTKILIAHPVLKIGLVGPNSL